jgi:hypothetical protein
MPLDYNNVNTPFYSEAVREFAPVQNWTDNDVNELVLYVRGLPTNAAAPLYVAIEDASQKVGMIIHPDPAVVTRAKWVKWKISFRVFTDAGVNGSCQKVGARRGGLGRRAAGRNGPNLPRRHLRDPIRPLACGGTATRGS